jgi:hypothetical protein
MKTSIRADQAEFEGYKWALRQGEIGLERPQGVNVRGRPDFITAEKIGADWWIIVSDVKNYSDGRVPEPQGMQTSWGPVIRDVIAPGRLDLGNPAAEQAIRDAFAKGRVQFRILGVELQSSVW